MDQKLAQRVAQKADPKLAQFYWIAIQGSKSGSLALGGGEWAVSHWVNEWCRLPRMRGSEQKPKEAEKKWSSSEPRSRCTEHLQCPIHRSLFSSILYCEPFCFWLSMKYERRRPQSGYKDKEPPPRRYAVVSLLLRNRDASWRVCYVIL